MSASITLVTSDPHLAQLVRDADRPSSSITPETLSTLAQPGTAQPEVLIVDLRQHDGIPAALAVLKRNHPKTGVLLVMASLDPRLMLEAMRAGVSECVAEPLTEADLKESINRLVGNLTPAAQADIFAVIGAKGGVGATSVAVNVATALALREPGSTLLIDLNITCDAAVFLGVEPRFSVIDALENVNRLDRAFFSGLTVRTKSGLDLLGAAGRPLPLNFDAGRIRTLLEFAAQTNRFTVLDVPRSDTAALDALDRATRILLVVNHELTTIRTAAGLAATLRQRYGQSRLGLVFARINRLADIGEKDVEQTVGVDIVRTFPSDYQGALEAMNKGRPIVLDTQHELSKAFTGFARDLAGVPASVARTDKVRAGGFFARLSPRKA